MTEQHDTRPPAQAGAASGEWQPIATVDRVNGRRLILAWDDCPSLPYHWEVGRWSSTLGWVNTYGHAFSGEPTHWMEPLAPATPAASVETYKSAADCPLGDMHGSASTHGSADGVDMCDFCGFPADDRPATSGEIPAGMVEEQDWMQMARDAAASVRPNSPWAGRVHDGMRDDGDEVRSAMAAIAAVCAITTPKASAETGGLDIATVERCKQALRAEQDRLDKEADDYLMDTSDCINVLSELLAIPEASPETGREGCVGSMDPQRATFFLDRFKREEKWLGPHEQWALDYTIGILAALSAAPSAPATEAGRK